MSYKLLSVNADDNVKDVRSARDQLSEGTMRSL